MQFILCQQEALLKAGELEVSPGMDVDKAELSSQTLLYQAYNMQMKWNDIETFF